MQPDALRHATHGCHLILGHARPAAMRRLTQTLGRIGTIMADFPKDRIAAIEKQIDRLRKEVDDRISSNHTLWRAGLAGIGALILLKESLDLSRLILLPPI